MAIVATPRLGLPTWTAETDRLTNEQMNAAHLALDDNAAIDMQVSTMALRPAAGTVPRGTYCAVMDPFGVYRSDGAAWVAISSQWTMSGATPAPLTFGAAGAAGTSSHLARADHVHAMPAHGAAAHSGIPLSAFAEPAASLQMAGYRLTGLGDPVNAADAATKFYVDQRASEVMALIEWSAWTPYSADVRNTPGGALANAPSVASGFKTSRYRSRGKEVEILFSFSGISNGIVFFSLPSGKKPAGSGYGEHSTGMPRCLSIISYSSSGEYGPGTSTDKSVTLLSSGDFGAAGVDGRISSGTTSSSSYEVRLTYTTD